MLTAFAKEIPLNLKVPVKLYNYCINRDNNLNIALKNSIFEIIEPEFEFYFVERQQTVTFSLWPTSRPSSPSSGNLPVWKELSVLEQADLSPL